jgi:hypothetical protein
MLQRTALVLASVTLGVIAPSFEARAFCRLTPHRQWANPEGIPVFLNTHLEGYLCHGDCTSFADLERTTAIALSKIWEQSGSRARFVYAGGTTRNFHDRIDGAIHITLKTDGCNDDSGADADCERDGSGNIKNCRLRFCEDFEWASFSPVPVGEKSKSYQGVLIHELLHALGLDHPENCGDSTASALSEGLGTLVATHLYEDDAVALRTIYGGRAQGAFAFRSNDGLTWQLGPAPHLTMAATALHSPSGCGAGTGSPIIVSYTRRTSDRAVQFSRFDGFSWSNPFNLPNAKSPYPTASACASAADQLIAWQGDYNTVSGNAVTFASRSLDGGATWTTTPFADTSAPGIGAAFDPTSGRYLIALRTTGTGTLMSQVLPDGQPNFHFLGDFGLRTAETPSIACGDPAIVGQRNCLLTWVSTNWDRFLWFAFGRVVMDGKTPKFDFDVTSLFAAPVVMFGTPSVTYVPDRDFPWQLVSHQGNGQVIALRRGPSHAGVWKPSPPVEFAPTSISALTSPIGASINAIRVPSRWAIFLTGFPSGKERSFQAAPAAGELGGVFRLGRQPGPRSTGASPSSPE